MESTKDYISAKLNPILEPLVLEILSARPDDPASFMINWLQGKRKKLKVTFAEPTIISTPVTLAPDASNKSFEDSNESDSSFEVDFESNSRK